MLQKQGRVKATQAGNFNRKFVESMVDTFLDEEERETVLRVCKVLNETDVWPLHEAKIVAKLAGFISLYKGTFGITKKALPLLHDLKAGELFVRRRPVVSKVERWRDLCETVRLLKS